MSASCTTRTHPSARDLMLSGSCADKSKMEQREGGLSPMAWKAFGVAGLLATAVYFALPGAGAKDLGYSLIGLGSVSAVIWGASRRPASERAGWLFIAAGNLCFVLGDSVYDLYLFVLHRATPFPSVADALYLAGYPFLIVGVVRLTRGHQSWASTRENYADAAIITCGALALNWHFLMASYAHGASWSAFAKFIALLYPVMDLAVLYIVVRGLLFRPDKSVPMKLLAAAMGCMLVSDFLYDVLSLHDAYSVGNPVDSGWLLGYTLVGAAALYPGEVTSSSSGKSDRSDVVRRLPLVALAGFVAPVILFASAVLGTHTDVAALSLISIVVFLLVVIRMRWMFQRIAYQHRKLEDEVATRKSLEVELRYQALHDTLTGLGNRALFYDRLQHALTSVGRSAETIALCFCDLDHFKAVNDDCGHLVGDQVLIAAGRRLERAVRPGDTVVRFGGDEFAVLLEGIDTPDTAVDIAGRIVSNLRQPFEIDGQVIGLSASVGIAVADPGTTTEGLLSQADAAMYEAKSAGKNRVATYAGANHTSSPA